VPVAQTVLLPDMDEGGANGVHPQLTDTHWLAYKYKQFKVMSNTSNPLAGVAIPVLCAVVNRGNNRPPTFEVTSNAAEGSGVAVPTPTWPGFPL
jgi:hypothetical protein